MADKKKKYRGFLLTELAISLSLLGILMVCLGVTLSDFGKFNQYQLVKQRCVAAAQAELDSFAATGGAIDEKDFKRLWPRLDVSIEQSQGDGQWEGLKLVKVRTNGDYPGGKVKVELCRYIAIKN